MIVFDVIRERNPRTGNDENILNRAWNLRTGDAVILPNDTPKALGARYCDKLALWYIPGS